MSMFLCGVCLSMYKFLSMWGLFLCTCFYLCGVCFCLCELVSVYVEYVFLSYVGSFLST